MSRIALRVRVVIFVSSEVVAYKFQSCHRRLDTKSMPLFAPICLPRPLTGVFPDPTSSSYTAKTCHIMATKLALYGKTYRATRNSMRHGKLFPDLRSSVFFSHVDIHLLPRSIGFSLDKLLSTIGLHQQEIECAWNRSLQEQSILESFAKLIIILF